MVTDEISHQSDVDQINRFLQSLAQRVTLEILVFFEIRENMRSATGEEHFAGIAGISAIQSFLKQLRQLNPRLGAHGGNYPLSDRVASRVCLIREICGAQRP